MDTGGVKYLFSTYRWISTLKYKVLTLGSWVQGRIPVEWVVMLRPINLQNTLPLRTWYWNGEMSVTLWEIWVYHLVRFIGRSVCSKKLDEDLWDVHFSCVMVEGRVVDSNMNGFSSNLFAILVYYLEVGDVGWVVVVGNSVFVNCSSDMAIVFFYSIFQPSARFSHVRKVAVSFLAGPFLDCILSCDGILTLGYIRIDLRVLAPWKMASILICQRVLLILHWG